MVEDRLLISAIVCTHNRAALLNDALASLANQTMDKEKYEVIIVDNASTDNTREVVARWVEQQPNFRYIYEPNLGLSHARNRGAAEAKAPIVAYIDDDARACEDWLSQLVQRFEAIPDLAAVGGPISLVWEGGNAPVWMNRHLMHALGYLNYGDIAQSVAHLNGGNMAIARRYLGEYGGFKPSLGRHGISLLGGEESDLMFWLRRRGEKIYYEPRAKVQHWVPLERQRARYLLRVYYGIGFSDALRSDDGNRLYRLRRAVMDLPVRSYKAIRHSHPINLAGIIMILACETALVLGLAKGQYSQSNRRANAN
jgi:glycosyltransferase involved in cell wall biosynthesis